MIKLQELFNILTTGPYAGTTFSGTAGVLKEEHYEKVCNLINLGMVELHKRFKFMENELVLHISPDTRNYYLRASRAALPIDITATEYIEIPDNTDGFLNITKILAAYDSSGTEIRLNRLNHTGNDPSLIPSIFETALDVLQITNVVSDQTISIVYQSYPSKIIVAELYDPDNYDLNVPDVAIDPLVSYIAAKTFKPMGANDSTANADKSATYEQAYELACQKLSLYGLSVQDNTERDTFDSKGWV